MTREKMSPAAKRRFTLWAYLLTLLFFLQACSADGQLSLRNLSSEVQGQTKDSQVIAAQNARAIKEEVTVEAEVVKLLNEDDRGVPHQKFLIALSNGTTVLVAHNIRVAPKVPLNIGNIVRIHGEYIWNAKGGLIHWTHLSDSPKHESGWIELNAIRYQ